MHDEMDLLLFIQMLIICFIPTKKALLLYQQNRYQLKRYWNTWKDELWFHKQHLENIIALFGMYVLLFARPEDRNYLLSMLLMIYILVLWRKEDMIHYRKPLVYTLRIKRCLCVCYLGYACLLVFLLSYIHRTLLILLLPLLYLLPWFFVLLVGCLLTPFEQQIKAMYINEAKRLLEEHSKLFVIGITGSYGKTSVKHILYQLLSEQYFTLMTPHSYNNMMGITITIRKYLQALHEVFICEMGADHVGEIKRLVKLVKPKWAIVTAIGPQHLSTFQTMKHILQEKMQIIEGLDADGIGFLNIDNEWIRNYHVQNTCQIVTYGMHEEAQYRIKEIHYNKQGSYFVMCIDGKEYPFSTKLLGKHNVLNIAGCIAVAHKMQISIPTLQKLTLSLPYVEHRLQLRVGGNYTILDDAYNSNMEGASYALEVLRMMEGKHIVVTPGFLDLGSLEKETHLDYGKKLAQSADEIILVGRHQTRHIAQGLIFVGYDQKHLHICDDIQEAFALLEEIADQESIVLFENDLPDAFNH